MPELPPKKVGIVACSGEELAEGSVTRLAALKVLEKLRPGETVTICLPLFLAGGAGDRAFAKFYPTIALDGCEKRCAYRGTEMYSNKPAASVIVSDLVAQRGLEKPEGKRRLNAAGLQAVDAVADQVASQVDELLGKDWDRRKGEFEQPEEVQATCSCGSGIPIQTLSIAGKPVTLIALPVFFGQALEAGKAPSAQTGRELLEKVKIYNPVPAEDEAATLEAIQREYAAFWAKESAK